MSFHSIPLTLRPTTFQWLTRIMLPLVVGAILLTSTGCSMVMGIFGPTEADITGVQEQPARLLVPTPMGNESASTKDVPTPTGPTPTPFIMRPVTTGATSSMSAQVSNLSTSTSVISNSPASDNNAMRVVLTGDAVNVRNAPGLDSQVLATLPRDSEFNYVSKTDAGDWVQVCCVNSQVAWVYADLAKVEQGSVTTQSLPLTTAANGTNGATGQSNSTQSNSTVGAGTQSVTQISTQSTTSRIGIDRTNDATRYTSKEDGFAVTLPPTWLPLVESRGLVKASFKSLQEDNPAMAALLEDQLSTLDDVPVSLIAFDLAPETLNTGFATNLNVIKQPIPAGFSLEYVVQFSADQLEQVLGLSGAAESTKVVLPAGEAIMLDYELSGQAVARQYYLMHDQAVYILTFTSAASLADSSIILFNEMMQSFTFTQ